MTSTQSPTTEPAARAATTDALTELLGSVPQLDVRGTGPAQATIVPWTGAELVSLPQAGADDVAAAFSRARIAQREWSQRSIAARAQMLRRMHRLISRNEQLLLDIVQLETGKSRAHAYDEVMEVYNCCRFYANAAQQALRDETTTGALPVLTKTRVVHSPVGVVSIITPWNYPAALATDVLAALVAGNAVVHKPDTQTTLTTIVLRRFALAAGLPDDVWQLVPGPAAEVGDALLDHADGVHFTGSTRAGIGIARRAAERLVPFGLELGGKNAAVVCADADIYRAVEGLVRGCFSSAGQLCLSFERIYVHEAIADDFISAFAEAAAAVRLGVGFGDDYDMGSLTSLRQLERVQAHVADAVAQGARVLAGGRARPDLGLLFYEPTVLVDVPPTASLAAEETFGPVVSIYRVASDAEAIAAANALPYGLNASVWSADARHAWAVARQLEAGMVNINEAIAAAYGSVAAPSGGIKQSGVGHRHGVAGLRTFTHTRTIAQQRGMPLAPSRLLPPERFRTVMSRGLAAMNALRMR